LERSDNPGNANEKKHRTLKGFGNWRTPSGLILNLVPQTPCHQGRNSFRGNVPYWDFVDTHEIVMTGCGRREENRFEPAHGTRLPTLIQWHKAEEVSEYERHRNAAIHEKQGNRNPLIDFPDLATRINCALGLA
jgi:endonuclease G